MSTPHSLPSRLPEMERVLALGGGRQATSSPAGVLAASAWQGCVRAWNSAWRVCISLLVKQSSAAAIACRYMQSVLVQRDPAQEEVAVLGRAEARTTPHCARGDAPNLTAAHHAAVARHDAGERLLLGREGDVPDGQRRRGRYAQQLCSFSTSCALLFRMIFLILPYCPNMVEERSVASFASEGARPMMYTKHRWMMRTLCR